MKLSVITPTYGRVSHLEEAIASFLSQDYKDKEMVIVNTAPEQTLLFNHPNILIANVKTRASSLGSARNFAIEASEGDYLVCLDDDDHATPHYLSTFAEHFSKPNVDFVFLESCFYAENYEIKKIMPGSGNVFAFSRKAWKAVGGYNELSVGEDTNIIGKITEKFQGVRVRLSPQEIPFVYHWGQGTYHASGLGADKEGQEPLFTRIERDLKKRIASGEEPTGEITLVPQFRHNWPSLVSDFLSKNYGVTTKKKIEVCVVQLGGIGEICNVLPILKHINDSYSKPVLMVSKSCASILDGVSYVEPIVLDLPTAELNQALELANKEFQFVLCGQTWGKNHMQVQNCRSYNEESWRNLGFQKKFEDRTWMPLFDKLPEPEKKIIDFIKLPILVRLSDKNLYDDIDDAFLRKMLIVSDLWMTNIAWLIRELNDASAVVTDDTNLLHLAAASNVPVVAVVESHPWFSVAPRCNVVSLLTREQVTKSPEDLIISIKAAVASTFPPVRVSPAAVAPKRRLWHAVDIRDTSKLKDRDRIQAAQYSWESMYQQGVIPAHYTEKKRTADKTIGDSRALPYLKDVLENAMVKADDADIIFFSNDDTWLHPQLPDMLRFHVSVYGPVTSSRREFMSGFPEPFNHTPEQISKMGCNHVGRDLFAATKEWLVAHWDEIPDAVLACTLFDLQLGHICRIHNNQRFDQGTLEQVVWPSEIPAGYVCHAHHFPAWANDPNDSPGQRHNKAIYDKFWAENKHKLEPV